MSALRLEILPGNIGKLIFDLPGSRANTLGQSVVADFETVLTDLEQRNDLKGLLLVSGKPGMFIAGADLKELAAAEPGSQLVEQLVKRGLGFIARFEKLPFPTIAIIDGACMGGGLETSLGFDYRLAGTHAKVEIGAPEVKVGLIPGWGGTQRLPRVVGVSAAIEMVAGGEPINAKKAQNIGLVFDVVPSDKLEAEAIKLLEWTHTSGDWKQQRLKKSQPIGLSDDQHSFTFAAARAQVLQKTKGQLPAPLAAVDAVAEGCNLPLDEALAVESKHFIPLVGSVISKNLIAIFFMQQRLGKDPGVADASIQPAPLKRVGVLGAGIMGSGIVGAHLRKGVLTLMLDVSPEALDKGKGAIAKVMQARIEIGRMTQDEMLKALGCLTATPNRALLSDCDLVVEAIVENEEIKNATLRELEPIVAPAAILASNTSTISITRMAKQLARPDRFAGLHFFNPVDRMQLVEVIRGKETSDQTIATLVAHAKKLGKSPIVVNDCPGFLVNRILFPYINEAMLMLEEGAEPRDIDKAATAFGMPMGPITLTDVVGLDTALFAGNVVNEAFSDRAKASQILGDLVKAGRLGQKSGAGFYSYAKGPRGVDDPSLKPFLDSVRKNPGKLEQAEIADRLFLPMLLEAYRILDEKVVRDPADVDLGLILGIGFPAHRGGLLRWAENEGKATMESRLAKYAHLGPRFQRSK